MRVADRPLPPVASHDPTGNPWVETWPIWPVIAVEPKPTGLFWDDPLLEWDDATLVWDDQPIITAWSNLMCDLNGFQLRAGDPDEHALFDAASIVVQVDNSTGRWSSYNVDGSLTDYGPGRHFAVWATNGVDTWWLFYGRVARWDELADDVIEIEAFDSFSDLAQPIGTYTSGVAGQHVDARINAILTLLAYTDRTRLASGIVTLTSQQSDQSPLEEMQDVAGSDGGILYCDADGTLIYADRAWRDGRADQLTIPTASDNVCTAPIIVWDPVLTNNDSGLADHVVLENIAHLRARADDPNPVGAFVYTRVDQQWTTQAEGDTLAAFLVQQQPRVAVDEFDLYLFDPGQPTLWQAVDWRIGDRLRFLHDSRTAGGMAQLDLIAVISTIEHNVTADGQWIMTVSTTKAVDYVRTINWDDTFYVWDDTNPLAVWGY